MKCERPLDAEGGREGRTPPLRSATGYNPCVLTLKAMYFQSDSDGYNQCVLTLKAMYFQSDSDGVQPLCTDP